MDTNEGYAVGIIDDIAYCPHHDVYPTVEMKKSVNSIELICPECDYKMPDTGIFKNGRSISRES